MRQNGVFQHGDLTHDPEVFGSSAILIYVAPKTHGRDIKFLASFRFAERFFLQIFLEESIPTAVPVSLFDCLTELIRPRLHSAARIAHADIKNFGTFYLSLSIRKFFSRIRKQIYPGEFDIF
jgi:hypothetical protein